MADSQTPDPLVYDVRDGSYTYATHADFRQWAIVAGIDVNDAVRVEVRRTDPPRARVTAYERNASGNRYCPLDHDHEPETCEAAVRDYELALTTLPPQKPNITAAEQLAALRSMTSTAARGGA